MPVACNKGTIEEVGFDTNLDSKIERGDKEEATKAYTSVRRGTDDDVNKAISMKANWYERRDL
jgi:hypothetical protein